MKRPRLRPLVVIAVVSLALAGCAGTQTAAIDSAVSTELSAAVVDVATASATGDYPGALSLLDALDARVDQAAGDEDITAARLVTLKASLARVRGELDALLAAATAPVETDGTTSTVTPEAPEPVAPDPLPEDSNGNQGNNGNGNGNGNGNEGNSGNGGENGKGKAKG